MMPPSRTDIARIGIPYADWEALASLAREAHPRQGIIAGHCVCGRAGYQPTPAACSALRALLEMAELAERVTR